jgi:hypothetical protein
MYTGNCSLRLSLLAGAALAMLGAGTARATTFSFGDEYFLNGGTQFSSVFPGATGTSAHGIYQQTNTTLHTITYISNGNGVPGEYVPNTTPNASQELALFGWGQSLNYGQAVGSVYNTNNPLNGTVEYFRYTVGGVTTPFNFNGFDLRGSFPGANLSFTLEGWLGGVMVDSAMLHVTGNTLQTYTENWANVDTIEIMSTTALPVNWGSGTLYMDNVEINDAIAVPEPVSIALLGAGLLGLGLVRRRASRQHKAAIQPCAAGQKYSGL